MTTSDLIACSRAIHTDESISKIAGYLGITDNELEDVRSKYTDLETQAFQTIKKWHTKCLSASKEDLVSVLKASGCNEASKQ